MLILSYLLNKNIRDKFIAISRISCCLIAVLYKTNVKCHSLIFVDRFFMNTHTHTHYIILISSYRGMYIERTKRKSQIKRRTIENATSNQPKQLKKEWLFVAYMHSRFNDRSIFRRPPLLPAKKCKCV